MKQLVLITLVFLMVGPVRAEADASARDKAEKMLNALGGAKIWRQVRSVHNTAVNHHPQARLPYIQEYWYDTREPSHHVTIDNYDFERVRAYTSSGGCSLAEGVSKPFTEERLQNELRSWSLSLYRKIFLIASDPENLVLNTMGDGRIRFEYKGKFIGWMNISADGTPERHGGTLSTESFTQFLPLEQFGDIFWPRGGQDNDGWDFEMLSIETSSEEMPDTLADPCVVKN